MIEQSVNKIDQKVTQKDSDELHDLLKAKALVKTQLQFALEDSWKNIDISGLQQVEAQYGLDKATDLVCLYFDYKANPDKIS